MSLFGSCEGATWTFDGKGWHITIPHCVSGEDLFIPKFKGVQFEGDPTVYEPDAESCVITLPAPEDQFTTCELGPDGRKATLTIPGKEAPLALTVNAVDGAVLIDEDGEQTPVPVVDCVLQLPKPEEICWGEDENNCPVVGIKHCQTGELLVLDQVQSVSGNVVDTTDPKNPVVTAVASVTGEGVDNTDPQNPVVNVPPVSTFEQDAVTGIITHTAGDATEATAQTKYSTTVPEGDSHIITTDDDVPTRVCVDQFKGIRDNEDGTYTVQIMNQAGELVEGDTIATIPDTDQRLTNPAITQETANGVTTHTVTWDVIDINGNVVGQESASGIPLPAFRDKAGNVLSGPITPMLTGDFVSGDLSVLDEVLAFSSDGSCKKAPTILDVRDSSGMSLVDDSRVANLPAVPAQPEYLDCDGAALLDGDQVVRKILNPDGTPWQTDGSGNQIAPCIVKDIALVKSALPGPYAVGDEVTYTFAVSNTGTVDLANVSVSDDSIEVSGGPIGLGAGESDTTTFTGTYTYTQADFDNGGHVNTATVTGVAPDGTVIGDVAAMEIFNLEPPENPSIMLAKTVTSGAGPYFLGDTVQYAFVVTNSGDVDLTGVVVTDPLLVVSGGPISLATGMMDATTFTGAYEVTDADVTRGLIDNVAETEGTSPAGAVVTDSSEASVPTSEVVLVEKCGTLAEAPIQPVLVSSSDPVTSDLNGIEYNTAGVAEFRTPGGTLLSTLNFSYNPDNGNIIERDNDDPVNPGTADAMMYYFRDGLNRVGIHSHRSFTNGGPSSGTAVTFDFDFAFTDEIGVDGLAVNSCAGAATTQVRVIDADLGSIVSGLSRPWDELSNPFGTGGADDGLPVEGPPGTFTFQAQDNAYLDWFADLSDEDQVQLTYAQNAGDVLLIWAQLYYTAAVSYQCDEDDNIVSASTIDGPLPESEWANIIPA